MAFGLEVVLQLAIHLTNMRIVTAILILISLNCAGQKNSLIQNFDPMLIPKKGAIKVSLVSPILLTINISYEYALSNKYSMQHGLAYTDYYAYGRRGKYAAFNNFQYTFDFRMYLKNKVKFHGWYQQPFIKYTFINHHFYITDSITNKITNIEENIHAISIGYAFGKQKVYNNKWLIDVYFGVYESLTINYDSNVEAGLETPRQSYKKAPIVNGLWFRPGLKVGYLF
ncbi:MAG: DUF3575 domain-containing protein [Bacteroidia bacterium]|nr:DUF3575 domain-containing protein [Bacteroidia bacterium]